MNFRFRSLPLGLLAAFLAIPSFATAQQPAQTTAPAEALPNAPVAQTAPPRLEPTGPVAVFDTSMGRITCGLFSAEAPKTVANFIGLAEGTKDWIDPNTGQTMHDKPFYDGTIFHRVIPGFMIQGGDPTGTGRGGPGYSFDDELDPDLNFDVGGRLAMANSGPNTNGSQFFITEGPQPSLNQSYTIFGQCDQESLPVVESIGLVERGPDDKPLRPVVLNKVTIVEPGEPLPPAPAPASTPPPTVPPTSAPSTPAPSTPVPAAPAPIPQR